jgi:hypothetical protein
MRKINDSTKEERIANEMMVFQQFQIQKVANNTDISN